MDLVLPTRDAFFSPCRRYRWWLVRIWDPTKAPWVVIALNPSVADEHGDDPTVTRLERRARAAGAGGLVVLNLFAWVSTKREVLAPLAAAGGDPVGPINDEVIRIMLGMGDPVICAWGADGRILARDRAVLRLFREIGVPLHAFKLTGAGAPYHPLYLPYSCLHKPWNPT